MWLGTGGGSDGLQSRFVLTLSEQLMPRTKTGNNELAVGLAVCSLENMLNAVSSTIELPETVGTFTRGLTGDGSHLDAKYTRVIDMGRRFALIVAACNGLTQIDDETMKLAAAFINYQVAAYEPLMPEDSYSWVQAVEQRIIAYFKKHQPATERDCRNNLRPDKSPAGLGTFKSAFNNLVTTEVLLLTGEENRVGKPKFELDSTYIES
jgi:hypothetical protein